MEPTNKEIYELTVLIGKHLSGISQTVVDLAMLQHDTFKILSSRLPSLTSDERKILKDAVSKCESSLEHYEAEHAAFHKAFAKRPRS